MLTCVQVVGGRGYVVGEQIGYQSRQHHIKLVLNEVNTQHVLVAMLSLGWDPMHAECSYEHGLPM